LGLNKREIFGYYVAFADQHNLPTSQRFSELASGSRLIEAIELESDNTKSRVSVPRQIDIALDIFDNKLALSLVNLTLATRAMARNYDDRLGLKVPEITPKRMLEWKDRIAFFCWDESEYEASDSAGDTYHFYESMLAALSTTDQKNFHDLWTSNVARGLYRQTTEATRILRHRLANHIGQTHEVIDSVGFEIGLALADMFKKVN